MGAQYNIGGIYTYLWTFIKIKIHRKKRSGYKSCYLIWYYTVTIIPICSGFFERRSAPPPTVVRFAFQYDVLKCYYTKEKCVVFNGYCRFARLIKWHALRPIRTLCYPPKANDCINQNAIRPALLLKVRRIRRWRINVYRFTSVIPFKHLVL